MKESLIQLNENPSMDINEDALLMLDFNGCFNGKEYKLSVRMRKQETKVVLLALYSLKNTERLKFIIETSHLAPNTQSVVNVKGVLSDKCSSDFVGKIIIPKKSQQTNSYLSHDVLVTGEETQNQSQPVLEIEANDVKASHGATTGRIDEQQMYYLCSRGLSKKEAEKIIIGGFFNNNLSLIKNKDIIDVIKKQIQI